jgi:hypothetical protein
MRAGVVEDADNGRVAASEHASDSARAAAVATAWGFVDEDLVSLHSAVQLVGWDEEVVVAVGALVGADEGVTVAVQIDAAGYEAVSRGAMFDRLIGVGARGAGGLLGCGGREAPLFGVELDELAASGDAGELFEEETALPATTQAKFADELLVAGPMPGRAFDPADEFAVGPRIGGASHCS